MPENSIVFNQINHYQLGLDSDFDVNEQTKLVRLLPDGDPLQGMTQGCFAGNVIEGDPIEYAHRFFSADREISGQLRVGVYRGSAYTEKLSSYACDEIMIVLEGSVTVTDVNGHQEIFEDGDCFFMPQGFSGYWKQSDNFKKFHMTMCAG